jgi:hypothetical protein
MTGWVQFSSFSGCNKVLTLPQTDGGKICFMNTSGIKSIKNTSQSQINSLNSCLNEILDYPITPFSK